MRLLRKKKGQSLLEYSIILAVIIVGIAFMSTYVRRGVQGMLKDRSDSIGQQYSPSGEYNYLTNRTVTSDEATIVTGNTVKVTTNVDDYTTRTGSHRLTNEVWTEF